MFADDFREVALALPGASEETPFGPDVLVYKVGGKVFALLGEFGPPDATVAMRANLKCDPERSRELRDRFTSVTPGYHMNKRHWNTLALDGSLPVALVRELLRHSYDLVVASLPRAAREELGLDPGLVG